MNKLTAGQRHLLLLIEKDKNSEGWTKVSGMLMKTVESLAPKPLVELEPLQDGGGRARLTQEGAEVVNAMKWL